MRKIVSLFLSVVMLLSLFAMPAMAETTAAATTDGVVMLDMDFTGETPATNYLDTLTESGTTGAYTTTNDKVVVSWNPNGTKKADGATAMVQDLATAKTRGYVGVVDAATEGISDASHTGNVFKYQHMNATDVAASAFLNVKLIPTGTDLTTDNHTVVLEYDIYANAQKNQVAVPNIAQNNNTYLQYYNTSNKTSMYLLSNGHTKITWNGVAYNSTTKRNSYVVGTDESEEYNGFMTSKAVTGGWHKVKVVADMSAKTAPAVDTFRIYVDGALQGTKFFEAGSVPTLSDVPVYDLRAANNADFAHTFYGLNFGGKTGASQPAIYYDNIKVTKYPGKFEVASQTVNATELTVTFNRNIDAATKDNAYVTDAEGTKVDATISASGKDLTVSGLAGKTNYKLVLPATFTDELGQGLVTYYVNNTTDATYANYKSSDKVVDFTTGEAPVKVTTLIDQDFENLPVNVKAFANIKDADVDVKGDNVVVKATESPLAGIGVHLRTDTPYASAAEYIASADLSVVNATVSDRTGNFLRYNNNSGKNTYGYRNQIMGTMAPQTTNSDDLNIEGSILVTEYDIYIEPVAKGSDNVGAIMAPSTLSIDSTGANYGASAPYMTYPTGATSTITLKGTKSGVDATNKDVAVTLNGWTKVRIVTDLTGDTTMARVYIGNTLVSLNSNHDFKTFDNWGLYTIPTTFTGLRFGGYGAGAGAVYYDNVNVYKVSKDFAIAEKTDDIFAAFGKEDTASITFTTNVDSTTVDELYLATTDGTKVDGGIAATVDSSDAKKVNITLGAEVGKGTYKIVIPAEFADIYGQGIGTYGAETAEIAVTTTDIVLEKAATIYEEDFDDWSTGNLLTTATAQSTANYYNATPATGVTVGVYNGTGLEITDASLHVGAVAVPEAANEEGTRTGNVFKYSTNTNAHFIVNLLGTATSIKGKTTIVESEVFVPTNYLSTEVQLPTVSSNGATGYTTYLAANAGVTLQGRSLTVQSGNYDVTTDRSVNETYIHHANTKRTGRDLSTSGGWHKLKIVYTDKGAAVAGGNPDTYRVYLDGALVEGDFLTKSGGTALAPVTDFAHRGYNYKDGAWSSYNMSDNFYGVVIGGKGSTSATVYDLYIDNIIVKTVDNKFAVTTATRDASKFNAVGDVITMTFTQPVDKDTVENIQIVDKNGDALDAVKAIAYADNDTVMNITLDADKLLGKEVYKVILPATFTDVYGQGLVTYYNPYRSSEAAKGDSTWYNADVPVNADTLAVTLTTAKATEIYIDDVTDGFANGTFTKTVTVNSVATEALPVWIAAAAYDAKNNMIGFCAVDEFTLEAGATTTKDLSFTVAEGKTAKYVRVFVWNGEDTMKPYQAIEEITVE